MLAHSTESATVTLVLAPVLGDGLAKIAVTSIATTSTTVPVTERALDQINVNVESAGRQEVLLFSTFHANYFLWKGRACTTTYCNLFSTCEACTRQPGCGWCDGQAVCIPGLSSRADTQQCSAWFYYSCYSPQREGCSDRIKVLIK